MAWLSPIHPPPVVFGVLKTPTRPDCCAFQDASQIPFLGAKKSSKNWGTQPNNDHVRTWKQKGAFKTSLKLTANAPENRPSKKGNESSHHP